ncbi:Diamine acetyltransferase 2 [Trachymyrmex cornetzi]|uniref:Diamine acetyltransferase 2 n=1 Tax=Trachymyrmex cornetzi TaxID=471704 RepID=A0A195DGG0_9HYME|nr:Diamine acetyltransferase 2 [Trachymyrmex cornetzi]
MSEIIVRRARREDCKAVQKLAQVFFVITDKNVGQLLCIKDIILQELLDYEKLSDRPQIDDKTFERDGFDGQPLYLCNVATCDEKIIGYAVSHYTYSTWCGKGMLLEDIYVTPNFRGKHVGSKLLKAVAMEAIENDCHKLDFVVLEWNPAQEFYKRHGAIDLTSKEPWHRYRIFEENLKKLASDCE